MITNSFKDLIYSKTWKYFHFSPFFALKFIPLFWKYEQNSNTIKMSETKVQIFYANANIKIIFTSFKKVHSKMKNIHKQKQKDRP